MAKFTERLKSLRIERKLSQAELSQATETSQNAICLYETGKIEPSIKTLVSLADYFDVSVDYLLGRSDDRGSGSKPSVEKAVSALIETLLAPGSEAYNALVASLKSDLGKE